MSFVLIIDNMYGYCVNYPLVGIWIIFCLILPLHFVVYSVLSRKANYTEPRCKKLLLYYKEAQSNEYTEVSLSTGKFLWDCTVLEHNWKTGVKK